MFFRVLNSTYNVSNTFTLFVWQMSINNLATVFGPTLIRPNAGTTGNHDKDLLTCGTVDVMAQAS